MQERKKKMARRANGKTEGGKALHLLSLRRAMRTLRNLLLPKRVVKSELGSVRFENGLTAMKK
jgi:hypothetical protein